MPVARLILMRHGKSDWSEPGQPDHERPLARRGARSVPRMAKWLRRKDLVPDLVVSSSVRRARETALAAAAALGVAEEQIAWDDRIYEADVKTLLEVIARLCRAGGTTLLVGHNPGLDSLLCHLSSRPPPLSDKGKLLTAGAVASLAWPSGAPVTGSGTAELEFLLRPRELERMGRN